MVVVGQFQDFSCPDGFPNIFVLSDDSLVFTSEKVGKHVRMEDVATEPKVSAEVVLMEKVYKAGFNNQELQTALDDQPARIRSVPFGPLQRLLYKAVMA